MRRRTPLIIALAAIAAGAAPQHADSNACRRHYTITDFHRYGAKVLPGPVTAGQNDALRVMAHCQYRAANRPKVRRWRKAREWRLTHVVYVGRVSVFGGSGDEQATADGGGTGRPCIALRRPVRVPNDVFLLQIANRFGVVGACDWGPAEWTGRDIDVTPAALARMRVWWEPTDSWGSATLLRMG